MSKRKDIITSIGAVIVVAIVVFFVARKDLAQRNASAPAAGTSPPTAPAAATSTFVVKYTNKGFEPATLKISGGSTVIFENKSSRIVRPASDPHPAHTAYPETGECNGHAFDSCKPIPPGGQWIFTFEKIGAWRYHNHAQANEDGLVVVE